MQTILEWSFNLFLRFLSQAPPFVMKKKGRGISGDNKTEDFEGLCIDILEEMRKELHFNYSISLAPDGKYGVRDKRSGQWNGVVRELKDGVIITSL